MVMDLWGLFHEIFRSLDRLWVHESDKWLTDSSRHFHVHREISTRHQEGMFWFPCFCSFFVCCCGCIKVTWSSEARFKVAMAAIFKGWKAFVAWNFMSDVTDYGISIFCLFPCMEGISVVSSFLAIRLIIAVITVSKVARVSVWK